MRKLIHSMHVLALAVFGWVQGVPVWLDAQARRWRARAEAGEGPVALILIILGIIAVAGIVIAAVTAYIRRKTNELG